MDYKEYDFKEKCYEAYKLDWMLSHGCTLTELSNIIIDNMVEDVNSQVLHFVPIPNLEILFRGIFNNAKDQFLNNIGFGDGSIYVCFEEFLENEFLDKDYMMHLFDMIPNAKEMVIKWLEYTR